MKTKIIKITSLSLLIVMLFFGVYQRINTAKADTCNSISDCQAQIDNANNKVNDLKGQATSYQNAISILSAQISLYQTQIDANQTQEDQLNAQIASAKADIAKGKITLASELKAMYVNGQTSTLEQLAGSGNLSTFVDAQTYRNAISSKISAEVEKLKKQESDLTQKETQVAAILNDEHNKQNAIISAQNQQQSMLSYSQSQISNYNSQTASNQKKLDQLIAAQRAANNASVSASGTGYYFIHFPGNIVNSGSPLDSYPYSGAGFGMSTAPGCVDNDGPDRWGYCTRQCVSYAAWAVEYSGRAAPIGWGNAKDWVSHARSAGIPFDSYPEPGDVAISTSGEWGHAMYIEAVSGSQIYVSQYNHNLEGEPSYQWRTFQ